MDAACSSALRCDGKIGPGSLSGEEADVAQQPGGMSRVACAVLAGAGIAGGAATGLVVADGLYPNAPARAPMVRPQAAAASPAALIASLGQLRAGRDSTLRPARPGHGRLGPARADRRARRSPVVRSVRSAPRVPSRPARGAPARVVTPAPVLRSPAPAQPVSRPTRAPRPSVAFDDSG
jgi:hypothetical protein